VATHGYWHELIYRQTPAQFAADLTQSLDAIGRALNDWQPAGYRAPAFSITRQSLWALGMLREHGIRYDSSIFPLTAHDRYGINNANRFASKVRNDLWEFPVSTIRLSKYNLPVAGGGYFRLFPLWITCRAIRHINAQGHPAVVYLHPWEFDPDQSRIPKAPLLSCFRHYINLHKTEGRLRELLQTFTFGTMVEAFAGCLEVC
jgi:polysaccharide deacetylase family protein (PEP-CTERM system associated)